jgi:cytochrome d ubiquinol oxidase subunit II
MFITLYPNVMVSSTNHAYNLTVNNSAAGHYALVVMTVTAVLFMPIVLLYQGWSFHVFRRRVVAPPDSAEAPPAAGQAATPT